MFTENEISSFVFQSSLNLHRAYGPGLFESVYEELLGYELIKSGLNVERQKGIPLVHDTLQLGVGFRADLIVNGKVIIEIKSVETLASIHYRQLFTYLKLTGIKLGLLINFNVDLLKDGFHRIVNKL